MRKKAKEEPVVEVQEDNTSNSGETTVIEATPQHSLPIDEDGRVNWKEAIPKKYFVINADWLKTNRPELNLDELTEEQKDSLPDEAKLLLLGGVKWAMNKRGYHSSDFKVIKYDIENNTCLVKSFIHWSFNEEYKENIFVTSALGVVNPDNLYDGHNDVSFLSFAPVIAENRALVRNVRNALRIEVLGKDELGKKRNGVKQSCPQEKEVSKVEKVEKLLVELNSTLDQIREKLRKTYGDVVDSWKFVKDIPDNVLAKLVVALQNKKDSVKT